jgi:hypothetical protein
VRIEESDRRVEVSLREKEEEEMTWMENSKQKRQRLSVKAGKESGMKNEEGISLLWKEKRGSEEKGARSEKGKGKREMAWKKRKEKTKLRVKRNEEGEKVKESVGKEVGLDDWHGFSKKQESQSQSNESKKKKETGGLRRKAMRKKAHSVREGADNKANGSRIHRIPFLHES